MIVNRALWIMFSSLNFISAIQSPSLAWMIQCLSILHQNVSKIIHTVQLKVLCHEMCKKRLYLQVLCHEMSKFISHNSIPSGLLIFTRVPIRNFKWLSALRAIYIFLSQFVIAHLFSLALVNKVINGNYCDRAVPDMAHAALIQSCLYRTALSLTQRFHHAPQNKFLNFLDSILNLFS